MKEEKLGKSAYEDPEEINEVSGIRDIFHNIEQWFWWNHMKLFRWFGRVIIIGLLFLELFGVYKCTRSDIERAKRQEIEWTTSDPTFVKKQDGYYISQRDRRS